ncbi:Rrf2 family transcriptional regulator [Terricaulis sp.]|jgi:Rrf2 family iron-sulfur cluster assembly transcriptional regulator|uniref:Rrf2 family transcriptional regulator n=1 Tax=Terricaulis sp. TaxID=2768686 RepID=UPI002AC3F635|nr:Rrf2 family transcriptional regulator [Terricaulis sp.]MDZ4692392.1 Rrf2 family transcriptional regulator [Terricaulis sp.]
MRLTSKGRYAVMAMADLALHGGDERAVPLQEVARRQEISLSYLEQLFARMRRAGLVAGVRGPGGGYRLARGSSAITVAEIIASVNEPIKATRCDEESKKSCIGRSGRCIAHGLWQEMGDRIQMFLGSVSLADVLEQRFDGQARVAAE